MYYLVAYVMHPSGSLRRLLQGVFGRDFEGSFLPVVSTPFASLDDANARLCEIRTCVVTGSDEDIVVQPEENDILRMPQQSAVEIMKRSSAWTELLRDYGVDESGVSIHAKEYSRCWVLIATIKKAQIPPGEAFVIDKHSARVFPRRYVDAITPEG